MLNIFVIHGENTPKSYKRLEKFINEAKKRGWEVIRFNDSKKSTLPEIISSNSLFGSERFFVVEDFKRIQKNDTKWINKNSKNFEGNLVIYHEKKIPKSFISSIKKIKKEEEYELPKLLFKFLESLVPGNAERSLNLLHTVLENEPPEFVFAMLARHFKDLYWVKKDPSNIPYPSWRVSKLESQASKFSIKQLKSFISKLAKTDVEVKTGKNDLLRSLDLLVMSELE